MGNIAEMEPGATEDATWSAGENSGTAIRCMTGPHAFGQPAYIGDVFYMPEPAEPGPLNDQGGVHVHNSILSTAAPLLEKAGMNLEDQARIWLTAVCAATPKTDFADFYHMFSHAAEICGFEDQLETIDEIFQTCRIIGGGSENSHEMADGSDACASPPPPPRGTTSSRSWPSLRWKKSRGGFAAAGLERSFFSAFSCQRASIPW